LDLESYILFIYFMHDLPFHLQSKTYSRLAEWTASMHACTGTAAIQHQYTLFRNTSK